MMSPANNTVSMVVLLADCGVYLCNFFKPSLDLHNLKKSSIFPRIGLYCFQYPIFVSNIIFTVLYRFFNCFWVVLSLNIFKG
jgi:hypothetical protein